MIVVEVSQYREESRRDLFKWVMLYWHCRLTKLGLLNASACHDFNSLLLDIQIGEDESLWAVAGDRVSISLTDLDPIQIQLGTVLCSPTSPVPGNWSCVFLNHVVSCKFRAHINTFDLDIPLTIGVPIVMHHLGTSEAGKLVALEKSVNPSGNEKRNPRSISSRVAATVVIQLDRPICCQKTSESIELSRFLLRKGGTSIASGVIIEVL